VIGEVESEPDVPEGGVSARVFVDGKPYGAGGFDHFA